MHITDCLRVYTTVGPKKRYGRAHDGGYIMRSDLPYDWFLSGGISDDSSFEHAVLESYPGLVCHAYDPHSNGGPNRHSRMHFHQEKLGYHGLDTCKNALVKMDIERDEWPWFDALTADMASRIAQLVIELHSPHENGWKEYGWPLLDRLASTHTLIHAHANNWDGIVTIDGVKVPGTLECTWVRRDLEPHRVPSRALIPGPLDMNNDPSKPDHVVDWAPFVEVG
jgi:hypothetical protein